MGNEVFFVTFRTFSPKIIYFSLKQSSNMSLPTISSGFEVSWFVEPPSVDLLCGICLDVLNMPRNCKYGHQYCEACLLFHLNISNKCPECRTYISKRNLKTTIKHKVIIKKIMKLRVKCNCHHKTFQSKVCFTWGQKLLKDCSLKYSGGKHYLMKDVHVYNGKSCRSLCVKRDVLCEICFV